MKSRQTRWDSGGDNLTEDTRGHTSFILHGAKIWSLWTGVGSLSWHVLAARWVLAAGGAAEHLVFVRRRAAVCCRCCGGMIGPSTRIDAASAENEPGSAVCRGSHNSPATVLALGGWPSGLAQWFGPVICLTTLLPL